MNLQEEKFRSESEVEEVLQFLMEKEGWDEDSLDELCHYGNLKGWLQYGEMDEPFSVEDAVGYAAQCV